MRLGVRVGPFWVSGSTRRRRRRSRPAQPTWQGTGEAFTPDGRRVRFQRGHRHRSQAKALECVTTRRKQIERGQNLHLVTRVLDTPESRQRAAERAEQKAWRQQELATQRHEAARQRAQRQQEARQTRQERAQQQKQARQIRAEQRKAAGQERAAQQKESRQYAWQERAERQHVARQARQSRAERQKEATQYAHAERQARRATRAPVGWPTWGNFAAAAAAFTGVVLAEVTGKNAHSPLAAVGALLLVVSVGTAAVCVPVAVWRKFQVRKRAREGTSEP